MAISEDTPSLSKFQQPMSRRAVMGTGIAATALAAVPVLAAAAEQADAELLAAGDLLDCFSAKFEQCTEEYEAALDVHPHLRIEAFYTKPRTDDELQAYRSARTLAGIDVHEEAYGRAAEDQDRQSDIILKMKAETLRGLAVKCKNIRLYASDLWDEPIEDLDYDKDIVRDLVEGVERLAAAVQS